MKIFIMGGTSSLGSTLKSVLSIFNEVITGGRDNCDVILNLKDSELTIPNDTDVVIHTAAHFGGIGANEILEAETINVLGTLKLCQAAVRAKAKHFVLISSIFSHLRNTSSHYSIYSLSKKHSEEVAELFCSTHNLPLTILRPSQLYGVGESFRVHHPFLYLIIDKAEKGEDISIYGSNDAKRNFIYIEDVAKIISNVIEKKVIGNYNCIFPADVTYSQIARAAFSAFKIKGHINFLKDKKSIPDNIFEKDYFLYEKINFYPQIAIEEGIKKIADYRKSLQ